MTPLTLADRLSEGRIPVAEGLRYAMILADTLRKMHDDGRAHGALSPATILLTGAGLDLLLAPALDSATSYMSPEVLAGLPADSRSDIFSFGAVVYEMLSGKRAFEGTDRSAMPSSGSPALDRLVSGCVAKDPAHRVQRIQKVMLELKLLAVSASRAAAPPVPRRDPNADAQLRAEMQQVEERLAARLQSTEAALADVQNQNTLAAAAIRADLLQLESSATAGIQANAEAISSTQSALGESLRTELEAVEAAIAARLETQDRTLAAQDPTERLEAMAARFAARLEDMERNMEGQDSRPRLDQVELRLSHMEDSMAAIRVEVSQLHDLVAADFKAFEKTLQFQSAAIESARTAMAQTDDLVERVVEALESLQSTVLEQSEERALSIN